MPNPSDDIDHPSSEQTELVKQTCLYVANELGGDLIREIRVVGGIVPSLIVSPSDPPEIPQHLGTADLDLGFSLAVIDDGRCRELAEKLRQAGFRQDTNVRGDLRKQRWRLDGPGASTITLDFLVPQGTESEDEREREIEPDLSAFITPGLELAFQDSEEVHLGGNTIFGQPAEADILVSGPGAFVVLKALAFNSRRFRKDAYDLYYVVKYFGDGVHDVAYRLAGLMSSKHAQRAVEILTRDFLERDAIGPRSAAQFLTGGLDPDIQTDVSGQIEYLLETIGAI